MTSQAQIQSHRIFTETLAELERRGYQLETTRWSKAMDIANAKIAKLPTRELKDCVGADTCLLLAFGGDDVRAALRKAIAVTAV